MFDNSISGISQQASQGQDISGCIYPGPFPGPGGPMPPLHPLPGPSQAINERKEAIFKGIQDGKLNKLEAYKLLKELDEINPPFYTLRSSKPSENVGALALRDKLEALDGKIARYRKGDYNPESAASDFKGETGQMLGENFTEIYNGARTGEMTSGELYKDFGEMNRINRDPHFHQKQENGEWVDLTEAELEDKLVIHLEKNYGHIEKDLTNTRIDEKQSEAYEEGEVKLDQYDTLTGTAGVPGTGGTYGGLNPTVAALMMQMQMQMQSMMGALYGGLGFGGGFGGVGFEGLNQIFQSFQPAVADAGDQAESEASEETESEEAEDVETE